MVCHQRLDIRTARVWGVWCWPRCGSENHSLKGGLYLRTTMSQLSGAAEKKRLRIITNLKWLKTAKFKDVDIDYHSYPPAGFLPSLQTFVRSFGCDYVLINGTLHGALKLALLNGSFRFVGASWSCSVCYSPLLRVSKVV